MPFPKNLYLATVKAIEEQGVVFFGPRVAVLRDEAASATTGGIIIPEGAKHRPREGTVVALGLGFEARVDEDFVHGVTVGHRVSFNSYAGSTHEIPTSAGKVEVVLLHLNELYVGWKNPHLKED